MDLSTVNAITTPLVTRSSSPTPQLTPLNTVIRVPKVYSPPVKPTEALKAYFRNYGMIDKNGIVTPELSLMKCPPLDEKACENIHLSLNHPSRLVNKGIDFKVNSFSPARFLEDLITSGEQGFNSSDLLIQILFEHIMLVGSGAIYYTGVPYMKDLAIALLQFHFFIIRQECPSGTESVVNKELESYLRFHFNRKLSDLDLRVIPYDQFLQVLTENLPIVLDAYTKVFLRLKTQPFSKEEKAKIVQLYSTLYPKRQALNIDDENFDFKAIRYLAFHDLCAVNEGKNQFAVASLPLKDNPKAKKMDIITVADFKNTEITPGVQWPVKHLLKHKKPDAPIIPQGPRVIQAFVNTLTGQVQPAMGYKDGKPVATSDDFRLLLMRLVRGETCSIEGGEAHVLEVFKKESTDITARKVQRMIKKIPISHIEDYFPQYLIFISKEVIKDHFNSDPLAAIAISVNLARMLENHGYYKVIDKVIEGLKPLCVNNYKNHVLNHILHLISDFTIPLSERLSFLKLLGYLFVHTKHISPIDYTLIQILPRCHEGSIPFCEIFVPIEKGVAYSVLLDNDNPDEYLLQMENFFKKPKTEGQNETLKQIICGLLPQAYFQGPLSSPLISENTFFKAQLKNFESRAADLLKKQGTHQQLMGLLLMLATQAQIENRIPASLYFNQIVNILMKAKGARVFILRSLEVLLRDHPTLISTLKVISESHGLQEDLVVDQWVLCLSKIPSFVSVAYQLWERKILANPLFDSLRISFLLTQLLKNLTHSPEWALKVLYDASKSSTSLENTMGLLNELLPYVNKDDYRSLKYLEDILSLNSEELKETRSCHGLLAKIFSSYEKLKTNEELSDILEILPLENISLPIEVQKAERLPKKTDLPLIKITAVKRLIKVNPFDAMYRWYKVLKQHRTLTDDVTFPLSLELYNALLKRPQESLKFIMHPEIKKIIERRSQPVTAYLVVALEKMDYEEENLNIPLILQNIEYLLKNMQGETFQTLKTVLDELERLLISPVKIPVGFIKSYTQLIPYLLNHYKNNRQLVLSLYAVSCLLENNKLYLTDHQEKVYNTLAGIIADHQLVSYEENIRKIINDCLTIESISTSPRFESVVKLLLKNAHGSPIFSFCFNTLTKIKKEFRTDDDLFLLHDCFRGFVGNNDHTYASLCLNLSYVEKPVDEYYQSYLGYLALLIEAENFPAYCTALLVNPFKYRLKDINTPELPLMLSSGLQADNIHVVQLLDILKIIKMYGVTDTFTMLELVSRCKVIYNTEVITLWWDILDNISQKKVTYSPVVEECLWILGAFYLKKCPLKKILDILLDEARLNTLYFKKISKENRFTFYCHLLDALLDKMAKNNVSKMEEIFVTIFKRHGVWYEELKQEQSFFIICKIADFIIPLDLHNAIKLISTSHNQHVEAHNALVKSTSPTPNTTPDPNLGVNAFREKLTPFIPFINTMLKKMIDRALIKNVYVPPDYVLFICTLAANQGISSQFLIRAVKYLCEIEKYELQDDENEKETEIRPKLTKKQIAESHMLSINILWQFMKDPLSPADIPLIKCYDISYPLAVLLVKCDGYTEHFEDIVLSPKLKLLITASEHSELLMHLGLMYFSDEHKTPDVVTQYEKCFRFYITNADALKVEPKNASTIIKEIFYNIFDYTIHHGTPISNVKEVLGCIKSELKEKNQDILWIKTLSKQAYGSLKVDLKLVISKDTGVRARILKTIGIYRDLICEIISSSYIFSLPELQTLMSYLTFLLILNDKEYLEDAFTIIRLLLKHNAFKDYLHFEYELAFYFQIKKLNSEEILKSIGYKLQVDKLNSDYPCACQNVLVEYTAALKLFKRQDLVKESKDFLLENYRGLLSNGSLREVEVLFINYFHASLLTGPDDKQLEIAKIFTEFLFTELKDGSFQMYQLIFNSLSDAILQCKASNRHKVIFLQIYFDRFYKFVDTIPKIKEDMKTALRFCYLQGLSCLNKRIFKYQERASKGIFLEAPENPYLFLCDYYLKWLMTFTLDGLKDEVSRYKRSDLIVNSFPDFNGKHSHYSIIFAYFVFFADMVHSRKPDDLSNEQLDSRIAAGTMEIYEHFYKGGKSDDRKLLDLMIKEELKFFHNLKTRLPYYAKIEEQVNAKLLDIRKRNRYSYSYS